MRPSVVTSGLYTATLIGEDTWSITREGVAVGKMFESAAYGWGRPHCSMRELVWSGPWPPGASDPRSPFYGWLFDIGPEESHQKALDKFAKHAERLIAWREKQTKEKTCSSTTSP